MKRLATSIALALILGLISTTIAAQGLIAMRVDIEPIRAVGELTAVALFVQIAPEDRGRVGADAWVKAELRDGDTVVDRLERAGTVDQQGVIRLEPVWYPGEYGLRVDVEGTRGTGFWRGRISIPAIGIEVGQTPSRLTEPGEGEEPQAVSEPAEDIPEPVGEPAIAAEDTQEVVDVQPEVVEEGEAATGELQPTQHEVREAAPAEPEKVEPTQPPVSALEVTDTAEPEQAEVPPELESITARPAEPTPEVEPPAPAREPAVVPVTAIPEPDPGEGADSEIAYQQIDTDLTEINVIVTEKSRPVVRLLRSQIRLKVDGKETLIESLAGSGEVPLSLGFAVDTSSNMGDYLEALGGVLGRLSIKAANDRGRFFILTQGEETKLAVDWGSTPSVVNQTLATAESEGEASLAEMVTAAMEPFSGRRGRKVLLIVTDGGDTATRGDWKAVLDEAGAAGVTVFVIGFQSDSLTVRTRSSLERLATSTGGEYYFIPDSEMLKMVVDYYSGLIDGTHTIGFRAPRGTQGKPYRIRVEIAGRAYDVRYPQSLRRQ